jgi:hypothetical protein
MDRPLIFKKLLTSIFILVVLPTVRASVPMKKGKIAVTYSLKNSVVLLIDTAKYQQQDEKKDKSKERSDNKEQSDNKKEPNTPEIREVPKARKQSRPLVVVKPNIKVKPIRVIRPHIKRP